MSEDSSAREGGGSTEKAWLEREELILNHLKATAVLLRLGYWVLRILLLLVALIALVGGGIKGKLSYVLAGLLLTALAFKLFRREYNSSYDSARAEVEAAIYAVRRGESDSFPPEYTSATQKLREPMLRATGRQMAILAGFLLVCAAIFIGAAVFLMVLVLMDEGSGLLFWGFSPVYILFILLGAPLGAMGVVYAKSAWAARKR